MQAFLSSFGLVALSEMGDKTQIVALLLVSRFKKPWTIIAGIFTASLLSNGLASVFGSWVSSQVPPNLIAALLALLFIGFGFWTLLAESEEEEEQKPARFGAYLTTVVLFFVGEFGDKTQLSTLALGAQFQAPLSVAAGATLGMTFTDGLVVFLGSRLAHRFRVKWLRVSAAGLFFIFGGLSAVTALKGFLAVQ